MFKKVINVFLIIMCKHDKEEQMAMKMGGSDNILMWLITITIAVQFFAGTIDTVVNSLTTLSGKSIPFASFFASDGVVLLLVVATFVILLIKTSQKMNK